MWSLSEEGEEVECVEFGRMEVEVEVHVNQPESSADMDGGVDTERGVRDGREVNEERSETGDTGEGSLPGNAESAETQEQSEDADV